MTATPLLIYTGFSSKIKVKTIRSLSATRLGSHKFQAVADPEQSDGNIKASPISKNRAPEVEKDTAEYYKVAFDYQADNSDELSLTGGDVIKVNNVLNLFFNATLGLCK
jgi:hypothetical protein